LTIRYWDSDCFIAWFDQEVGKYEKCKATVDKIMAGEIKLVVSAITLIEVIKLKNHNMLPRDKENTIKEFFQNDFMKIVNVDRYIGEIARNLIWRFNVHPKDSIHVATAILHKVPVLNTFDKDLLKLSEQVGGTPVLKICEPDVVVEPRLEFEDEK